MFGKKWNVATTDELIMYFGTNETTGLRVDSIPSLLDQYGKNQLSTKEQRTWVHTCVAHFKNPLVFILLLAGIATLFLNEYIDAVVIFIALIINVSIGTIQEERAGKAFEKLNASQTTSANVIRDGRRYQIPSVELIPGDIVIIEAGGSVPADLRLIETKDLSINESALTGEWVSVEKRAERQEDEAAITEQFNMAWMSTLIVEGHGKGVVVSTGNQTEMGKIAEHLKHVDTRMTPVQQSIRNIASFLIYFIGVAIVIIFALGILRGETFGEMLLIAIALSGAAIPQGLPAAVTAVLALGMEKILKKGGLVRSLLAAETLGSTTIILTDKTGTLTQAKMKVVDVHTLGSKTETVRELIPDERFLLQSSVLASDAYVEEKKDDEGGLVIQGRPVEKAILLAGLESGLSQDDLKTMYEPLDFLNFSSDRRYGAALTSVPRLKANRLHMSGSPEHLLDASSHVYQGAKELLMTAERRQAFDAFRKRKSEEGMRMIGIAYRNVTWDKIPLCEEDHPGNKAAKKLLEGKVVFLGFIMLSDPVREDVPNSIDEIKKAGVRVIMATGDSPVTGVAIAKQAGIFKTGDRTLSGTDVEHMSDEEILTALSTTSVFARVLPAQKLRIARILKNSGEVVAMTGDGINDAPALQSADIGVAVGSGTEVAKEASDMILIDNSFSIIVEAIRIGRGITANLKKIVAYLVSTSFSGIAIIGGALILGLPLPILPTQLLWANIVEEGLMSFAFAFEPGDKSVMQQNPRSKEAKQVLTSNLRNLILLISATTGLFLIGLYVVLLRSDYAIEEVRTMMFVALTLDSLFFAFSLKDLKQPLWRIPIWNNRYLLVALTGSVILLVAALTFPPLQFLLSTTSLSGTAILLLVFVGLFNLVVIEVMKYVFFGSRAHSDTIVGWR